MEPNYLVRALYTPNDLYYGYQWALPAINASTAWDYEKGNESVKIVIVDTGIQYNHPDIASNYVSGGYDWVNDYGDPYDDHGHGTHCAGISAAVMDNEEGIAGAFIRHRCARQSLSQHLRQTQWNDYAKPTDYHIWDLHLSLSGNRRAYRIYKNMAEWRNRCKRKLEWIYR